MGNILISLSITTLVKPVQYINDSSPIDLTFLGKTTFLREYYHDNTIISWSHDSAKNIDFWQKMSIVLQKKYVKNVFNACKFNLNTLNIQAFMLDKDQNLLEKYYFYEGNTTQLEDLQKYLQTEVYANGIAQKTTVLLKNRSVFCSGGKFIKKVEKEFDNYIKDKCLFIISVKSFISKITNTGKLDVSEINNTVGKLLEDAIHEDELLNLGELTRGNSLELLSDSILSKLRAMKDKNVAAEVLARAIKTTIGDIGKINLTLQEKFSTKFNKIVDMYNERTDIADIEKVLEEMIALKKEIEDEIASGNKYNLSSEEKAFFDALGADSEIKELMKDEVLVQIAKELVELINDNLTLDAFKREDARARIRINIRRLLIDYNYPPVKREGAVDKVIKQAELRYQEV